LKQLPWYLPAPNLKQIHGRSKVLAIAKKPVACIQDFRGVYFKPLSCLLNGPSLVHYCRHRCLALCLIEASGSFFIAQWFLAHSLRSASAAHTEPLPSDGSSWNCSPPPAIAPLRLQSLPSTCNSSPPPVSLPSTCQCNRSLPPAITLLHLQSLPSASERSLPPSIAPLYLQSLPLPAIAPLHLPRR
jgi:hypothetical protein